MGCIFEFFAELFGELFLHLFLCLGEDILPDRVFSEKTKGILKKVFAAIWILLLFAHIIGIVILVQDGIDRILGWVLFGAFWIYLLIGFGAIAVKYLKNKNSK